MGEYWIPQQRLSGFTTYLFAIVDTANAHASVGCVSWQPFFLANVLLSGKFERPSRMLRMLWVQRYMKSFRHPNIFYTFLRTHAIIPLKVPPRGGWHSPLIIYICGPHGRQLQYNNLLVQHLVNDDGTYDTKLFYLNRCIPISLFPPTLHLPDRPVYRSHQGPACSYKLRLLSSISALDK